VSQYVSWVSNGDRGTGVCLGWTVLAIFAGLLLIIDLLFLDESAFLFEPDFDAWQAKSNSPY